MQLDLPGLSQKLVPVHGLPWAQWERKPLASQRLDMSGLGDTQGVPPTQRKREGRIVGGVTRRGAVSVMKSKHVKLN